MHKLFRIHEILDLIARNLPTKHQSKMAMLCRTFYEPTMDELWHTINTLRILIRCLPGGLLEWVRKPGQPLVSRISPPISVKSYIRVMQLRFTRVPELHDRDRVRHYARRVRVLLKGPHDLLSAQCLCLIEEHYPEPHLLPKLRQYHLGDDRCDEVSTLFLICLSLQHVRYEIRLSHEQNWHLDHIARRSPNIRVLTLAHADGCSCITETDCCVFLRPQAVKALSDAIYSFRSLTEVRFSTSFDHNAIRHLSTGAGHETMVAGEYREVQIHVGHNRL